MPPVGQNPFEKGFRHLPKLFIKGLNQPNGNKVLLAKVFGGPGTFFQKGSWSPKAFVFFKKK